MKYVIYYIVIHYVNITFQGAKHSLNVLVPDLLMKELPNRFFLDTAKLKIVMSKKNQLGGGVAGLVYKGKG